VTPIVIDFGTRPVWRAPGIWLFVFGCLLLILSLLPIAILNPRIARLQEGLHHLDALRAVANTTPATAPRDETALRRFANAALELDVPWEALFGAIEGARTDSITILSIEPDAHEHTVRIVVVATSYAEALGFLERLSNRRGLRAVVLNSHELQVRTDHDGPVRAVLEARWGNA
jgi:hypothetical protein